VWVNTQRQAKRAGTLSEERIKRLNALGFVWDPIDAVWEQRFAELVAYKAQDGDCHVPNKYPENPALGVWVNNQRGRKRAGTLSQERIKRLDALGCVWDPFDVVWEQRFAELVAYKTQHGDCRVPAKYPENSALGVWVNTQRAQKRAGTLSKERSDRLDALGFVWEPQDADWEERFAELVAYKTQHGDCHVPRKYPENPALGVWVNNQRAAKRAGTLSKKRIARLNALGFVWDLRKRTR